MVFHHIKRQQTVSSLQQGRQITICWTMKGFARVLPVSSSTFRKALVVFSGYARQKLVTEEPATSNLLVNGGTPRALKLILEWIATCCNDGKIVQFEPPNEMGFMAVWQVYKTAIILEIPSLQTQVLHHLKLICSGEVNFQDCRQIFTSTDPDKIKFQGMVAQSIANAMFENRLRYRTEISMLRAEVPAFNDAVTKVLDPLVNARNKAWMIEEQKLFHACMEAKQAEERKLRWKEARKEEIAEVAVDWTIIEEDEPEEDWVIVNH